MFSRRVTLGGDLAGFDRDGLKWSFRGGRRGAFCCFCLLLAVSASCDTSVIPGLSGNSVPGPILGTFKGAVPTSTTRVCTASTTGTESPKTYTLPYDMTITMYESGQPVGLWLSRGEAGADRQPVLDLVKPGDNITYDLGSPLGVPTSHTVTVLEGSFSPTRFHFVFQTKGTQGGASMGITGTSIVIGPTTTVNYTVINTVDGVLSGNTLTYSESIVRDDTMTVTGVGTQTCHYTSTTNPAVLTKQ